MSGELLNRFTGMFSLYFDLFCACFVLSLCLRKCNLQSNILELAGFLMFVLILFLL